MINHLNTINNYSTVKKKKIKYFLSDFQIVYFIGFSRTSAYFISSVEKVNWHAQKCEETRVAGRGTPHEQDKAGRGVILNELSGRTPVNITVYFLKVMLPTLSRKSKHQ